MQKKGSTKRKLSLEEKAAQAKKRKDARSDTKTKSFKESASGLRSVASMFAAVPKTDNGRAEKPEQAQAESAADSAAAAPLAPAPATASTEAHPDAAPAPSALQKSDVVESVETPAATAVPVTKSKGQGAAKWKPDWLTGDRAIWVKLSEDGSVAHCAWCLEYFNKQRKAAPTSWATTGCTTRKEASLRSHEDSADHRAAAAAQRDSMTKLARQQDQAVFSAFEGNFMILYHNLQHRVGLVLTGFIFVSQIAHSQFPDHQDLARRLGCARFDVFTKDDRAQYKHSDVFRVFSISVLIDLMFRSGNDRRLRDSRAQRIASETGH